MSTRSSIAMLDGKSIKAIYCHHDGYLSGVGETLKEFYSGPDSAKAVIALGDLSSLKESLSCPEGHSFSNRIDGYTVAYGRDIGGATHTARSYTSIKAWIEKEGQEFNYFWDHGWWVAEGLCPTRFSRLSRWEDPEELVVEATIDLFDSRDYDEFLNRRKPEPEPEPESAGLSLEQALEELRKLRTSQLSKQFDGVLTSDWEDTENADNGMVLSVQGKCKRVHKDLIHVYPNGWAMCHYDTLEEVLSALNLELVCYLKPKS